MSNVAKLTPEQRAEIRAHAERGDIDGVMRHLDCDGVLELLDAYEERTNLPAPAPVCSTCSDTHTMELRGRIVMCTRCPTPCQECRSDGIGPYCETTPCACECHKRKVGA